MIASLQKCKIELKKKNNIEYCIRWGAKTIDTEEDNVQRNEGGETDVRLEIRTHRWDGMERSTDRKAG